MLNNIPEKHEIIYITKSHMKGDFMQRMFLYRKLHHLRYLPFSLLSLLSLPVNLSPLVRSEDFLITQLDVRRSQLVTFAAIRLQGPGFKPPPGPKFETRFLLHSHPSGGKGVSPVQGEAIRRRYIKPE